MDPRDRLDLLDPLPATNLSVEHQIDLLLTAVRASNTALTEAKECWAEDLLDVTNLQGAEVNYLDYLIDYTVLQRLPSPRPRGNKMLVYRVAAALFNNSLREAQVRGKRLNERPTTPQALERALNRLKLTSVE